MNDEWAFFIVILPLFWILFNISSFIIIFLHELSHAIPALFFTKRKVSIFIGTYGDRTSKSFNIGKLTIYIKPKFSYVRSGGICIHENNISLYKRIIILVSGPVITALIAFTLLEIIFSNDAHGSLKALVVVLFGSSMISLIVNVYPQKIKSKFEAHAYYTDGYQILSLIKKESDFKNLLIASQYYDDHDYLNAIVFLEKLNESYITKAVFSLFITCYIQLNNYESAKKFNDKYIETKIHKSLNSDDFANLAYINIQLKDYNKALMLLDKSLELNIKNFYSLNNRGHINNILENYNLAKNDLNNAINVNPDHPYSYINRAFSNIKLGLLDEALIDINKSLSMDETNSYGYLNMGLYQFERGNLIDALTNFERAKELDESTLSIDEYINKTKEKLVSPD